MGSSRERCNTRLYVSFSTVGTSKRHFSLFVSIWSTSTGVIEKRGMPCERSWNVDVHRYVGCGPPASEWHILHILQPLVNPISTLCQPFVSVEGINETSKSGQSGHTTVRWKANDKPDSMRNRGCADRCMSCPQNRIAMQRPYSPGWR